MLLNISMNRFIFPIYLNPNYNDINSTNFIQISIISSYLADNADKLSVFLEKKLGT